MQARSYNEWAHVGTFRNRLGPGDRAWSEGGCADARHGGEPDEEVRAALGLGFPKHPLHKIVCIGALLASRQPEGWQVDALGSPHIGERSEAELIGGFVDKIGQLRPQLITFNGNSFDLPVLRYRAMVNRVSAVGLQVRPYFHRYYGDALDLCDALASYGPGAGGRRNRARSAFA
jgi:hypothetical protein